MADRIEAWKNVKGYEGLYLVSDLGRLKSLRKNKIMKPEKTLSGYLRLSLTRNGRSKQKYIHQIVASAFIENVDSKDQVNHKNEIKSDNRVCNLEWCTPSENVNYGTRNIRVSNKNSIPIYVIFKDGKIKLFNSIIEASRSLNCSRTHIIDVLKGRNKTHYGMRFKYAVE